MKIFFQMLFAVFFLLLISACRKARKDVNDYYPAVKTISATVNEDGSVALTANVTLQYGELDYIGFCMDTLPVPSMLANQQIVDDLNGSEFKYTYSMNFDPAKTYYFRSWAASGTGYSYGNVIPLTNIKATPVTAACSLNPNSSNLGLFGSTGSGDSGSVYKVTAVSNSSSTWDINCQGYDASAGILNLSFGSALKTKVFTTTEYLPNADLVFISVTTSGTSGVVKEGAKVYVNQISTDVYEITICSALWGTTAGSPAIGTLNARFKSPF